MLCDKNTKSGPAKLRNFAKTESLASRINENELFASCCILHFTLDFLL